MPQAASADCIACESDAPVLAIGDQVFVRAEVRRLDHDGRVVMLSIPAVLGTGVNYIVAPPSCIERREPRRNVRRIVIHEGR